MATKAWDKYTEDELLKMASQSLNADDDWGYHEKWQAGQELERRRRLRAELDEKLKWPEGKPKPTRAEVWPDGLAEVVTRSLVQGDADTSSTGNVVRDILAYLVSQGIDMESEAR